MQFFDHTRTLFQQLQALLDQVSPELYSQKQAALHGSSVGQHLRHIIEFFLELEKGYQSGMVNYDSRERTLLLETDKDAASANLQHIAALLQKDDKSLQVAVAFGHDPADQSVVGTTYYREVIYNIEHTVHHMATIKTGVQSFPDITLPASFGTAASTQRYQKACAP